MAYYTTALEAELIKKKHTGTFLICLIMGVFIPLVFFIVQLFTTPSPAIPGIPYNFYEKTLGELSTAFGQFFFPLLIIITATKITAIDHKNGGWQLMETQPLSKWSIYSAKLSVLLLGNLIAILAFLVSAVLIAWGLLLVHPPIESVVTTVPVGFMAQFGGRLFLASLFLSAVLLVIAMQFKNFIAPVLIGFLALLGTLILNSLDLVKMWNPFTVLGQTSKYTQGSGIGRFLLYTEWVGLIGFAFIASIGYVFYQNKTLKRSFSKPKSLFKISGVTVVAVLALIFLLKPNIYGKYKHTVLSGTIKSDREFSRVLLIDEFTRDTLAEIPVTDNSFHQRLNIGIPLAKYLISFDGAMPLNMEAVLGSKDSLYIELESYNGKSKVKGVTGTRLAENRYTKANSGQAYVRYLINRNEYLDRPEWVAEKLYDEWQKAVEKAGHYRTKDNYAPRPDFKRHIKKIITAKYLNLWHGYLDKVKVINPNILKNSPAQIVSMKKQLGLHDNSLMGSKPYLDYVLYELTKADTTDSDFLTKRLRAVQNLSDSDFKDRLLFAVLKDALANTADARERQDLMATYNGEIKNPDLRALAIAYYNTLDRLAVGSAAPEFKAFTLSGKPLRLSDFRGKWVVIDVWATWCGPCLREAPYYERSAIKHKSDDNIVFIALSIDKNKQDWYLKAKSGSPSVLQLHLPKAQNAAFSKAYALSSIPRYLFIDKNGNFISSAMPFPSKQRFGIRIKKAIGKQ